MYWFERGFDPGTTGFNPGVLVLAGTYQSSNRHGHFEVTMRGHDLYLRREWNSGHWWKWEVESLVTNHYRHPMARWRRMGFGGGGGGGEYGQGLLVLARRLWSSNGFVGASGGQLCFIDKDHERSEEFAELKELGPYRIPMSIKFTDRDGVKVYHVRRNELPQHCQPALISRCSRYENQRHP